MSSPTVISPTTLQDLPIEVLDDILMKALIKKVQNKKLAKSAWINYASRVIGLIRTVSSQWNCSLTTNWFKIVLCRKLNNYKDPTTISVERISRGRFNGCFNGLGKFGRLNNTIYCLSTIRHRPESEMGEESCLRVFEGQDMIQSIKDISLPSMKDLFGLATCKQSNSLYVWQIGHTKWPSDCAVWHLVLDETDGIEVFQWPTFTPLCDGLDCSLITEIGLDNLCALDDGSLLALRIVIYKDDDWHMILSVHKPDGLVMRTIELLRDVQMLTTSNVRMKSNGNFVYAQVGLGARVIREVDEDGRQIHEFHYPHKTWGTYRDRNQLFVDANDRVIFHDGGYRLIFLDCELNFLGVSATLENKLPPEAGGYALSDADFDKEKNEMIVIHWNRQEVLFLKLTV